MQRFSKRLAALGLAALAFASTAQAQVVISQVYGGGGNSGATLKSDFIELHNTGSTSVSVAGWSVQYASSAGSTWQKTNLTGSIAPGGYYLVKQADGTGGTIALPTPDATGTIAMAAGAGKVALVASQTALTGTCPTGNLDFVGYGAANCAEGNSPTGTLSATLAALRKDEGCSDTNVNSADFALAGPAARNSATSARVCGATMLTASIADASVDEGNTGTRALAFTVSLTGPAGPGGVRFRYATTDITAAAGSDYTATDAEATIPEGADRVQVTVAVLGDAERESDETFRVDLGGFAGAAPGDASAIGTILNDDFPIVPIAQIQGAGAISPLKDETVATRGIVTGRRSNGFYLQSREIDADADPATSEGLFVFTGSTPAAFVQPGRWLVARGRVIEYVPSTDPGQAPLTELGGSVTVSEVDTQLYPLPAPVALTATFPDPAGPLDQLERVEGMRVTVPDFVVTAPTGGFTNETQALGGSNGVFHGTVAGVARPFREPGIQAPDAPPSGSVPPIPRWDFNPELISIDSDALGQPVLDLATGARIANLTGPLDYGFRRYTILPDADTGAVTPGPAPRAAKALPEDAFTVAGYNVERFFDEINDPAIGEPVLRADAFERRLQKASLGIRDMLRMPDILAVVEMENLDVLRRLAARVGSDAVAAGQADPQYAAYLVEGNDVGGIDVGFMVKTADIGAGTPRVEVRAVTQVGKDTQWTSPDGVTGLLNDRPPLLLQAVVRYADGRAFPLEVLVVHQRSLIGVEDATTSGARVRAKRQRQAEFLAGFLDARQKAAPDTRIVVLGDFNAFEFNDGLAHTMGTVTGEPAADEQTAVEGDGADLVEPNLVNLGLLEPQAERYSFVFGGNAQTLDHVLVNEDMVVATRDISLDHARINADFPAVNRSDATSPSRLADHDPVVAYFVPRRIADLGVSATADAESHTGHALRFEVVLANAGPEQADRPAIAFDLDAAVAATVAAPAGWDCGITEQAASLTRLLCRAERLAHAAEARFTVSAPVTADLLGRTVTLVAAVAAQSWDRNPANDAASAQTTVVSSADLSVALQGPGTHLRRGTVGSWRAVVANAGPDLAVAPELQVWGNAPAANVAFDAPAGWDCEATDAVEGFRALCSATGLVAGGTPTIDVRVVGPQRAGEPFLDVRARVSTRSVDTNAANDEAYHRTVLTGTFR